jgi:hypothetical protein
VPDSPVCIASQVKFAERIDLTSGSMHVREPSRNHLPAPVELQQHQEIGSCDLHNEQAAFHPARTRGLVSCLVKFYLYVLCSPLRDLILQNRAARMGWEGVMTQEREVEGISRICSPLQLKGAIIPRTSTATDCQHTVI